MLRAKSLFTVSRNVPALSILFDPLRVTVPSDPTENFELPLLCKSIKFPLKLVGALMPSIVPAADQAVESAMPAGWIRDATSGAAAEPNCPIIVLLAVGAVA